MGTKEERKKWVDMLVENQTPRQLARLYEKENKRLLDCLQEKIDLTREFYGRETAFLQDRYDMELLLQKSKSMHVLLR